MEVEDNCVDLSNLPPVLNELPPKAKEDFFIECGVAAGEAVLSFCGVDVEARPIASDDGKDESLVAQTGRCHHVVKHVGGGIVLYVVGVVEKGYHQSSPISISRVVSGVCKDRSKLCRRRRRQGKRK